MPALKPAWAQAKAHQALIAGAGGIVSDCNSWAMRPAPGSQAAISRSAGQPQPTGVSKVPSMLFEMEIEDVKARPTGTESDYTAVECLVRSLAMPLSFPSYAHAQFALDVRRAASHLAASGSLDTATLAQALQINGHAVCIRTSLGGGAAPGAASNGQQCLTNLRHTFLCWTPPRGGGFSFGVAGTAAASPSGMIVDPSFREQFSIARPTARYCALVRALPEVLVLPEDAVLQLVDLLCTEMAAAFRAAGEMLPPWRRACSMLSKWLPRKSLDHEPLPSASAASFPAGSHAPQQAHAPGGSQAPPVAAASGAAAPGSAAQRPAVLEPQLRVIGGNFTPAPGPLRALPLRRLPPPLPELTPMTS